MKVCPNCNATLADHVVFCPSCGSNTSAGYPQNNRPVTKEPVSVGGWIGRSLIPYIPLVGALVYLIMLFIWSGDTTKEETFRNWAKAQLIVMAIVVGVTIVLALVFGTTLAAAMNSYY